MKMPLSLSLLTSVLIACQPVPTEPPLPLLAGYRDAADQCVRVGENDFTNQFLDDSADLVGCPEQYEGLGLFQFETSAVQVGVAQGYILFSVKRG